MNDNGNKYVKYNLCTITLWILILTCRYCIIDKTDTKRSVHLVRILTKLLFKSFIFIKIITRKYTTVFFLMVLK